MKQLKKFDYRLQIWDGKKYTQTYVYSDGTREQHNDAIRALYRDPDHRDGDLLAYRIVDVSKDRTLKPARKDMNWGSTTGRRNLGDGISMKEQAQVAADHYISLRTRDLTTHLDPDIKTDVAVYPVKPSGRGVACEFRLMLASLLIGAGRTSEYWGKTIDQTRKLVEKQLADHGYTFTEVDLEDYA